MSTTHSRTTVPADRVRGAVARAIRVVLEGRHAWGRYEVSASRSGATHFRLTVFPPGTNAAERRALARARDWPLVGAIAGLVVIAAFGDARHPLLVSTFVLAVYTAGVLATRVPTRTLRARVRTVDAVRVFDGLGMTTRGDLRTLQRAAVELHRLDEDAAAGRLGNVEYEAHWAAIYESLSATRAA